MGPILSLNGPSDQPGTIHSVKSSMLLRVTARPDLRVFGSLARGNRPNGDIDFLVDVEPARTLLDVIALKQGVAQQARTLCGLLTSA